MVATHSSQKGNEEDTLLDLTSSSTN